MNPDIAYRLGMLLGTLDWFLDRCRRDGLGVTEAEINNLKRLSSEIKEKLYEPTVSWVVNESDKMHP